MLVGLVLGIVLSIAISLWMKSNRSGALPTTPRVVHPPSEVDRRRQLAERERVQLADSMEMFAKIDESLARHASNIPEPLRTQFVQARDHAIAVLATNRTALDNLHQSDVTNSQVTAMRHASLMAVGEFVNFSGPVADALDVAYKTKSKSEVLAHDGQPERLRVQQKAIENFNEIAEPVIKTVQLLVPHEAQLPEPLRTEWLQVKTNVREALRAYMQAIDSMVRPEITGQMLTALREHLRTSVEAFYDVAPRVGTTLDALGVLVDEGATKKSASAAEV